MPTITKLGNFFDKSGSFSRRAGLYTGPASYVTSGDSFPPESVSLGRFEHLDLGVAWDGAATTRLLVFDRANKKVLWFVPNTGAQVANGTDVSAFTATFEAVGV